jgi:hypothetical protein
MSSEKPPQSCGGKFGKVIPFADPEVETSEKTEEKEVAIKELSKPEKVAVLTDDGIVSAGEAFIIKVMKFKKVT